MDLQYPEWACAGSWGASRSLAVASVEREFSVGASFPTSDRRAKRPLMPAPALPESSLRSSPHAEQLHGDHARRVRVADLT